MTASIPNTTVSIGENRQLTYTEYGDAGAYLTAVLDDADVETAGLVAFSGGSAHALAAAASHPDRIDRVDVVAGATPPSVSAETPTPQRVLSGVAKRTPRALGALLRGQAFLAERLDPSFVVAQYTDDPDSVSEEVQSVVKADFLEAFAESRSGAVTEFRNTASEWDVAFEAIDAEVCLWHGECDTNVPVAGARELKGRIPGAELQVLEGADHLQTLQRATPDVLAAQGRETSD